MAASNTEILRTAKELLIAAGVAYESNDQINEAHNSGDGDTVEPSSLQYICGKQSAVKSDKFSFSLLKSEFVKVCPDFTQELTENATSQALDFACKIFLNVGPQSIKEPKHQNRHWTFKFGENAGKIVVSKLKSSNLTSRQPMVKEKTLILTLTQANLLAAEISCMVIDSGVHNILPPLAAALFTKFNIEEIVKELYPEGTREGKYAEVLKTIIQSCLIDGHHLESSHCSVAMVSCLYGTRNIDDAELRSSTISKAYKQYLSVNKKFDSALFEVYANNSVVLIMTHFTPSKLIAMFDEAQLSRQRENAAGSDQN